MAIAHVCMGCGLDLARVRLRPPESHYGLRLVICPRCSWTCTRLSGGPRSRHPIWQGWRTYLRVQRSIAAILGQVAIVIVLIGFTLPVVGHVGSVVKTMGLAGLLEYETRFGAVAAVVLAVLTGTWLSSCFPHWRHGTPWLAWTGLLTLVVLGVKIALPLKARMDVRFGMAGADVRIDWEGTAMMLAVFGTMMMVSLAGVPLGGAVRVSYARRRALRWSRRRRRLRAQGQSR
jgi:hypothetical protein